MKNEKGRKRRKGEMKRRVNLVPLLTLILLELSAAIFAVVGRILEHADGLSVFE
jgi:hypothetical protein